MSTGQRVIKYLAVAFGLSLAATIIFSIASGLYAFTSMFTNDNVIEDNTSILWRQGTENISSLDIDINYSDLVIKTGTAFMIETNNSSIKYKIVNNKLEVEENRYYVYSSKIKSEVIITIPDMKMKEIDIDAGAGNLNIDSINTETLDIDLGAGNTLINNLYSDRANIDTGAGTFTINNGRINDLDLDTLVGEVRITSNITGNSSISSGVGKLSLNLLATFDNYRFDVSKGIGKVTINDTEVEDNSTFGNGTNIIKLDGGIGEIVVNFKK